MIGFGFLFLLFPSHKNDFEYPGSFPLWSARIWDARYFVRDLFNLGPGGAEVLGDGM